LIALQGGRNAIKNFPSIILLEYLAVSHGCDSVIVEFEPPAGSVRFDASKIVTTVKISWVDEDTM
jgi:hypothetical protein